MYRGAGTILNPYRVLDLTDEKGFLCGKILGDLGADVIKVERPGGDPSRMIGPFYQDEVHPEKSLLWWAYNTSKRGITLEIESPEGKETFKKLVKTSDFVVESFSPGYMDSLGLGYENLQKINPGIIMVSISPFGQTGPYRDFKASDIVVWAMGGQMYPCGDADRPPVRISQHSQAYLHTAAEAAVATLMALQWRQATGQGQHVDVSMQELIAQDTYMPTSGWDFNKLIHKRGGLSATISVRRIWPCKDGHVMWVYTGGAAGESRDRPLVNWMAEEGMADDFLRRFDWSTLDYRAVGQEIVDRIETLTAPFFLAHTKSELYEGAIDHRVILYPIYTVADILKSVQLAARGFCTRLEHPELGKSITYPGMFCRTLDNYPRLSRRAPLIGEHNAQVLEELANHDKTTPVQDKTRVTAKVQESPRKLLAGIKVVDFTWNIVGPLMTKTMADYGAEVIRVEHESRPDPARQLAPPFRDEVPGLNRSGIFNKWNTGKMSLALNLTSPKGVEIVRKLIARADIVVETFAGGVMGKMGLGYEALRKINPGLIMLSSCMMGQTGPHATHPGYGWNLGAMAGFFHLTGWPDRDPVAPDGPYTDFIAPRFGLATILSALDYRRRTGKGQYIDISQFETGISFLSPLVLDYLINGRAAGRIGNRYAEAAPHGAFRCEDDDRWCAISVFTNEEWASFCTVIGSPSWTEDSKFASLKARKENEDELERLVEVWTLDHPAEEVMTMLQAIGVPAGVVQNGQDLLENDPQLRHRHSFWQVDHPEIGKHLAPTPSFSLSKCPCELRSAPLLGEHSEFVLTEILGLSEDEITALVTEGIVG